MIKALLLALFALVVVHHAMQQKPKRVAGESGTSDCVREGFDAYGLAHPNGGRA